MTFDASPALTPSQRAAVEVALERAGLRPDRSPRPYETEWRQAAIAEASGRWDEREDAYALSPRSTRGATRA